jgi:hypothetical protein
LGARLGFFARALAGFLLRCAFVLVIFEGMASLVLFTLDLPESIRAPHPESRHTRYDPELGWSHVPRTRIEDFFGAGRHLTINAQGFRGDRDVPSAAPDGRIRLVCSGDAFTLGYGVGDPDTWCARLETLEPRFESINMGQGGYGIDQSYLWYTRDGLPLEHDVQLFAFSRQDFGRMQWHELANFGKPYLRVEDGALRVHNVPVPRLAYRLPWIVENAALVGGLRSVQLVRPVIRSLFPERGPELSMSELAELTLHVFGTLQRLHEERGSRLVLVYLPTLADYENPRDLWRRRIRNDALEHQLHFVDLVERQKALPAREVASFYLPEGTLDVHLGQSPFNERGNAWVAQALHEELIAMPEVAGPLARTGDVP